jgi:hypothetical protein
MMAHDCATVFLARLAAQMVVLVKNIWQGSCIDLRGWCGPSLAIV